MEISAQEIKQAIVSQDDFGHEMRVGALFSDIGGYEYSHGGTYSDPVTKKPRQYDYRARIQFDTGTVALAVECKNLSPIAPLVICGRDRSEKESFHYLVESRFGNFQHRNKQVIGQSSISLRVNGHDSIYRPRKFVGKSITRLKKDNKGINSLPDADIYDRWAQALGSGIGLVEDLSSCAKRIGVDRHKVAILPAVIVPNGTMWKAHYSTSGEIEIDPAPADRADLFLSARTRYGWAELNNRFVFSHIHFFTLEGFRHFLGWIANNDHSRNALFSENASEV